MALIKCPECQKDVSDSANTCPNCGFAIASNVSNEKKESSKSEEKNKKGPGCLRQIGIAFAGLIIIIIIGLIATTFKDNSSITPVTDSKPKEVTLTATKELRVQYGEKLRDRYLDQGLDIVVTVDGKYKDRIILTYILFSDVWVHQMEKGTLISEIEKMGFRKFTLQTGGAYENKKWWWDLNPKQHGYLYK